MNFAAGKFDILAGTENQALKMLAVEMLELTAVEIARPIPDHDDHSPQSEQIRRNRMNGERWINAQNDPNQPINFEFCCSVLNIEPETVRHAMKADTPGLLAKLRAVALALQDLQQFGEKHARSTRPLRPN